MKEKLKKGAKLLKHKGFQLVCVARKRSVLKQMSCRKWIVGGLSIAGEKEEKMSSQTLRKNTSKLIIKIALLMINRIAREQKPSNIKGFDCSQRVKINVKKPISQKR